MTETAKLLINFLNLAWQHTHLFTDFNADSYDDKLPFKNSTFKSITIILIIMNLEFEFLFMFSVL